jgi:hypothetical protein
MRPGCFVFPVFKVKLANAKLRERLFLTDSTL